MSSTNFLDGGCPGIIWMLGDDLRPTWMLHAGWVSHDAGLAVMFTFWELSAVNQTWPPSVATTNLVAVHIMAKSSNH